MHWIHAKVVGKSPWGWRDGVVVAVDPGGVLTIEYLLQAGQVQLWHHQPLAAPVGSPVRVHEGFHAVGGPFGWCNVFLLSGLGAVPEPADPRLWQAETHPGIVDLATGRALPMDHPAQLDQP